MSWHGRLAQEALANAIRHGKPAHMDIGLAYAKGQLLLSVTDDGKGFDLKRSANRGMGLNSMRERAEAIGANLQIESGKGNTRTQVHAPANPRRGQAASAMK